MDICGMWYEKWHQCQRGAFFSMGFFTRLPVRKYTTKWSAILTSMRPWNNNKNNKVRIDWLRISISLAWGWKSRRFISIPCMLVLSCKVPLWWSYLSLKGWHWTRWVTKTVQAGAESWLDISDKGPRFKCMSVWNSWSLFTDSKDRRTSEIWKIYTGYL